MGTYFQDSTYHASLNPHIEVPIILFVVLKLHRLWSTTHWAAKSEKLRVWYLTGTVYFAFKERRASHACYELGTLKGWIPNLWATSKVGMLDRCQCNTHCTTGNHHENQLPTTYIIVTYIKVSCDAQNWRVFCASLADFSFTQVDFMYNLLCTINKIKHSISLSLWARQWWKMNMQSSTLCCSFSHPSPASSTARQSGLIRIDYKWKFGPYIYVCSLTCVWINITCISIISNSTTVRNGKPETWGETRLPDVVVHSAINHCNTALLETTTIWLINRSRLKCFLSNLHVNSGVNC